MDNNIRNFCIIAHIDHGKSTLADRFLELTGTVEKRKMREQYLDMMDLEREKGITIKMQPVRMIYSVNHSEILSTKHEARNKFQIQDSNVPNKSFGFRNSDLEFTDSKQEFVLNLIDTPGHIDFSYEVSRSLKAVEGAVLLVDATQGVQAQTVGNLEMAKALGLVILPVINKIDSPNARVEETKKEIVEILECEESDIIEISAKTGENCDALLKEIVRRIPPPTEDVGGLPAGQAGPTSLRALVFDFEYSPHRGVILYVRVMNGNARKGDSVFLYQAKVGFFVSEVGFFNPFPRSAGCLRSGEIGYIVTNVKEANIANVGDTLLSKDNLLAPLEGYKQPSPVVWASVYPESQNEFPSLKKSMERLRLSDSALGFEEEESGTLGRGFRCGFLGMLHLEIVVERLRREFNLNLVVATPSVVYKVENKKGEIKDIYSPALFPEHFEIKRILEPWVETKIIFPFGKVGDITQLVQKRGGVIGGVEKFGENRVLMKAQMSLREMMGNFFEETKSITAGYASLAYKITEDREGDLVRLDVLLNDETVSAFSRITKRSGMEREARIIADKLKKILPPALFPIKIQVKAMGRILASMAISALKKDVTGHLYGGDRTRKMKLWQKQKRGKEKLRKIGRVSVPHGVFLKMIKNER